MAKNTESDCQYLKFLSHRNLDGTPASVDTNLKDAHRTLVTTRMPSNDSSDSPTNGPDPILLTLFANRFMSVAEAMGRSLQQTSISTNIKERLDFSCALFAPDGDLVANAPFIPIHLGSMSL